MHLWQQLLWRVVGDLQQHRSHPRRPELTQVLTYLRGDLGPRWDVTGNLICHFHQSLMFGRGGSRHAGCSAAGRISTAVTLYSGQLVAQSELSVVITLVPLTGWWKVV